MAEAPARYCSNCGNELSPEDQFCQNCGTPVHQAATVPTPEADVPVPPPPQPFGGSPAPPQQAVGTQRSWPRRHPLLTGCLGLLGLFVFLPLLIGLVAAIGGGGGGGESAKNDEPRAAAGKKKEQKPPVEPVLDVSSPSKSTTVTDDTFSVKGKVTPAVSEVTVNGGSVTTSDDGSFGALLPLDFGENEIKITATNGSKQDEHSQVVTRQLSEKEIAAKKAAEKKAAEEAAAKKAAEEAAAKKAAEEAAAKEAAEKKAAEEAAAKKAAEEAAKNATIGDTVRVGDAEWTVTNARYATQLRQKGFGSFGDTKQGNFVVIDFTFTNRSNESVTLDTFSLPLYDSKGREYEVDTDTFGYVPQDKDIFLNQVNPGVTQEGEVIYSVAPDASGFVLHAGDLDFFGTEEAKITLGF